MRHLVELGHRRIAVIRGPEELFDSAPRWAGVREAAAEAGIRFDERLVFQLPGLVDPASGFEGGLDCARRMLVSGCAFTAVLAFDDLTALGVVRGLTEAGLRVPRDCSVLGGRGAGRPRRPKSKAAQSAAAVGQANVDGPRGHETKERRESAWKHLTKPREREDICLYSND